MFAACSNVAVCARLAVHRVGGPGTHCVDVAVCMGFSNGSHLPSGRPEGGRAVPTARHHRHSDTVCAPALAGLRI
jgi:hypothetical protein